MILISMAWLEYRGRPATTRTRLVQALVLSDLLLGYVLFYGARFQYYPYTRFASTRPDLTLGLRLMYRIVGLIGNSLEISPGHRLKAGTATCDGLGFVLIAVLWTEHVWTLCLAVGTYLILIHVRPPSLAHELMISHSIHSRWCLRNIGSGSGDWSGYQLS